MWYFFSFITSYSIISTYYPFACIKIIFKDHRYFFYHFFWIINKKIYMYLVWIYYSRLIIQPIYERPVNCISKAFLSIPVDTERDACINYLRHISELLHPKSVSLCTSDLLDSFTGNVLVSGSRRGGDEYCQPPY